MRIRLTALIPLGISLVGWITSPQVTSTLPANIAHGIILGGIVLQTVFPALFTQHPPTVIPTNTTI